MKSKSISLIGIVFVIALCLYSHFSFAFFFCPTEFPVNCGNVWCCTEERYCPEPGEIFEMAQCTTRKELCPSTLIFGEGSEEVMLLRYFRDNVLSQTPEGQELIRLYYEWSPAIVKAMEQDEEFKEYVKEMVDGILLMIKEEVE